MIKHKNITIESYDRTAEEYYNVVTSFKILPELKTFTKKVKSGGGILDLGCGPGHHSKFFYSKGFKVEGIDLSKGMIEVAKEKVPEVHFQVMDIQNLNFEKNSFDGIWASASILHIQKNKVKRVLSQVYKILKNDGVFYLSLKKGRGSKVVIDSRYNDVNKYYVYYREEEIERLLVQQGFELIETLERDKRATYDTNDWIHVFCRKNKLY